MPAEVKILVEGESNANEVGETGEEKTRPTITLVKDGDLIIIVDPGIIENQNILVEALAREGLTTNDINLVCITHSHIDHYRNIGMFPKAKALEYFGLWRGEFVEDWPESFSPHIQILKTPGHDYTGITIFVTTEDGVVAICGDIFWKEDYPKDIKDDTYASDPKILDESRKMVLKKADWIIPGHGPMYRVKTGLIENFKNITGGTKKTKSFVVCKKCKRPIKEIKDNCICRPWLCYRCCECGMDCDTCNCSHKKR
jgi:glyoxylase-like metal-dependent hydrolase (beta-lactamase superfamily II)